MSTLGTCLIWWAWFAFNGGSTVNLSIRSIYVVVNTNLLAMGGCTTWAVLDYTFKRKLSLVGARSGVITGTTSRITVMVDRSDVRIGWDYSCGGVCSCVFC